MVTPSSRKSGRAPITICNGLTACFTRCCIAWKTMAGSSRAGSKWRTDANANIIRLRRTARPHSINSAASGSKSTASSANCGENNMPDLEEKVAQWRMRMAAGGVKTPAVLDELESHLREDFQARLEVGDSEAEAFESAAARIGSVGS